MRPASTRRPAFTPTANGATVNVGPFHDAHGFYYTVYWNASGSTGGTETTYKLVDISTGLVLGVKGMSTADGGLAVVWGDTGTADRSWVMITNGSAVRLRNVNSGRLLAILNGSSTWGAQAVQDPDNGTADNVWRLVELS